MGIAKKKYFIIYCTEPSFATQHSPDTDAFLVELAHDYKSLLSKVKTRRPKAILVIENPLISTGIAGQLREASTLDNIPIFVFGSIKDAKNMLSSLVS